MEDEGHGIHEIEDTRSSFENSVVAEDYCQRFKARLSARDMEILELRVKGFTYEEIAVKLGYKNHSGVLKRMKAITKMFLEYEDNLR
jgi:FixJ family two-component response regulator